MRQLPIRHARHASFAALALLLVLGACSEPTAPPRVTGLILTPLNDTVSIGASQQLVVTAIGASGSTLSGVHVDWSTSAPSVAAVSPAGLVTGLAAGTATITATAGDISRTATILVRPADCGAPSGAALVLGGVRHGAMSDSPCLLYDAYTATGYPLTVSSADGMRLQLNSSGFSGGLLITDTDNLGIVGFPPGATINSLRAILLPGNYRVWVLSSSPASSAHTFSLSLSAAGGRCEGTPVTRTLDLDITAAAALTHDSCVLMYGPSAEGWRVVLTEPTMLRVTASSAAFAPTVAITDTAYTEVISYWIGSAPGSVSTMTPLPAGVYYVWGGSFDYATGTLQISAEAAAPCATSGTLTLGAPVNAALQPTDCPALSRAGSLADVWTLTLAESTTVNLSHSSAVFDAYLELRTAGDLLIAANDDDGATLDSRIVRTLAPGTYRVWATSYSPAVTGAYTLTAVSQVGGALRLERAPDTRLSSPSAKPDGLRPPAARPWPVRRSP